MGVTTVEHWSRALVAAASGETPVAILRRVSFPDQQRIDTTLAAVAAVTKQQHLRPPWFSSLGTSPRHGAAWTRGSRTAAVLARQSSLRGRRQTG